MLRCRGDDDVSESRHQSFATRPIRHRAGDPRSCRIEGENAITVQMQDRSEQPLLQGQRCFAKGELVEEEREPL